MLLHNNYSDSKSWVVTAQHLRLQHGTVHDLISTHSHERLPHLGEVEGGDGAVVIEEDVDGVQGPRALGQQTRLKGHHHTPRLGSN